MSRFHYDLDINPECYRAIEQGKRNFVVCSNDCSYSVYDILHLRECVKGEYTGRTILAEITYTLDDEEYCKDGYIIMAIKVQSINN